jgi:hypothetical protein
MTEATGTTDALSDDLSRRQSKIRRRQLMLAVEQWAPAAEQPCERWLPEVCTIMDTTEDEATWLEREVSAKGPTGGNPRDAGEWHEIRRAQGRQAVAAAGAAFLAGDYAGAHDLVDDALAYGAVPATEWRRLHAFIEVQAAQAAAAGATGTTAKAPAEVV